MRPRQAAADLLVRCHRKKARMESIVAAVITAMASITVAIIQMISANRQAVLLRQAASARPQEQNVDSSPPSRIAVTQPSIAKIEFVPRLWIWVTLLATTEAAVLPSLVLEVAFANVFLFPVLTVALAYFRPLRWGWAAVGVAFLHGANYFGYWIGGGTFSGQDLPISVGFYVANAAAVSLVAFFRLRRLATTQESDSQPEPVPKRGPLPGLSEAARELLLEAAQDAHGVIMRLGTMGGTHVQTNNRNFVETGNTRSAARWRGAVDELHHLGLVEDRTGKGEVFFVTDAGYRSADLLRTQ